MQLDHSLRVIAPAVRADVLGVLALADRAFSARRIHQLIGLHSEAGVRRVLDRLVAQGIVLVTPAGRSKMYELNRRHLAAPYVLQLARLKTALVERLRDAVDEWELQPVAAALFGTAARGGMREDSDIDLILVRPTSVDAEDVLWRDQLRQLRDDAWDWTGNDIRILEMSEREVRRGVADGDPLLNDIRTEGIMLTGPLRKLLLPTRRQSA